MEQIMKSISKAQISAIYGLLAKHGLREDKEKIIEQISGGRTSSTSSLYFSEALSWISAMSKIQPDNGEEAKKKKLLAKLFAMAHEIGWITVESKVVGSNLTKVKNYTAVHNWVKSYGYLKKGLREYTYEQLPKLVTQFQFGPYKYYLSQDARGSDNSNEKK